MRFEVQAVKAQAVVFGMVAAARPAELDYPYGERGADRPR